MKLHLCSGDIYLKGYINIDIDGYVISEDGKTMAREYATHERLEGVGFLPRYVKEIKDYNPINETDLEHYFKFPFIKDPIERTKNKRPFIIDKQMDILKKWDFEDNSVDEIVMISCIEHFDPKHELPHILKEINRVMKIGGQLKTDWPDLKAQFDMYYGVDDEMLMELVYCNHKSKYAIHHWGFTPKIFPNYLGTNWNYEFKEVVKHDYPMQGCIATKQS